MAGEATIGALRVILGADTAKFEDNLKSAAGLLGSFGKQVAAIASGIGIEKTIEKAFGAITESIQQAIDTADKLSKASQKFGIPVETLSTLSAAAQLSDVSLEQLGSSLSRVAKNMVAAQGPTSEQATAFKALGVSIKDSSGQFKAADQILLDVADSFSKFRDGTTKTALAVAIFGRAGADMIPFLNEGSKGIADLTGRMSELGIVINADTAKAAERFNDDLKLLEQAKTALILKIVGESGLLNAMVQLAEAMLGGSRTATQLADVFSGKLGGALVEITKFVDDIRAGMAAFGAGGETQSFLKSLEQVGTVAASAQAGGIDKLVEGVKSLEEAQKKLAAAPPAFDPNAAKNLEVFNEHLAKLHDQALDASGVFAGQLAPGFLTASANLKLLQGQIDLTSGTFAKLGPQAQQLNNALIALQGAKLTQDFLSPWDQYEQSLTRINLLLEHNAISAGTAAKASAVAGAQMASGYAQVAENITSNFAGTFKSLADMNSKYAGIAKAAAIAEATAQTFVGAVNAYAAAAKIDPFILAPIAAGAAVAAGLANVAKITATQFAKGGSFMVPGGRSGVDNQLVPLALASGERVDITPANQAGRGGSDITLRGIGSRDLFTGDMLRGLVDALNAGHRDGYRLKIAER